MASGVRELMTAPRTEGVSKWDRAIRHRRNSPLVELTPSVGSALFGAAGQGKRHVRSMRRRLVSALPDRSQRASKGEYRSSSGATESRVGAGKLPPGRYFPLGASPQRGWGRQSSRRPRFLEERWTVELGPSRNIVAKISTPLPRTTHRTCGGAWTTLILTTIFSCSFAKHSPGAGN